ncbi:F-box/WD-40 repeat-containing protein, partial [Cucurbita argyrosperma subsp. sororia]
MAFECQKSAGFCKDSRVIVKNSCEKPTGGSSYFKLKGKSVGIESEKSEFDLEKGDTTSLSSKQLGCRNVPLGCRSITDLPPAIISEILNCLDPKELGIVSCVSTILHRLASEHHVWKEFYNERWGLPIPAIPAPVAATGFSDEKSWKDIFVEREFRSKTFMGRYSMEVLHGHTEAVRTVFLLVSAKLIFTSGYDSIVRIWDLEEGLSIASSRSLGCTVRALAADTKLLVAGGTDGFIHCWKAIEGLPHLFDVKGPQNHDTEFRLWEHEGPITTLALDLTRIYSGSWDMTVRVWDRFSQKCLRILRHGDWAYALARSHTGDFLFTGGEDGAIHMFDVTNRHIDTSAQLVGSWIPHSGPVYSLAFEFPWLVSASSDGKLSLIDVRALLRTRKRTLWKRDSAGQHVGRSIGVEPPQRMLHGFGSNLFGVDIGLDRIVCGGEEGVVRIWNFSQALETERRARALRGIRLENRMRRRRLQIEMNTKGGGGGGGGRSDRCSVAAKKTPMNSDNVSVWHNKRGVSGKLKA